MITIRTHADTLREQEAREQLLRILETYDLKKWLFTSEVLIQQDERPHSHPVLTLNCRYVQQDEQQLRVFLHEQMHWFATAHEEKVKEGIEEFKKIFPSVPVGGEDGARSEFSSYLHLIICYLELCALSEVLGQLRARELLSNTFGYKWIYKQVLENTDLLAGVVLKRGLVLP
jgi:hypothetical protein